MPIRKMPVFVSLAGLMLGALAAAAAVQGLTGHDALVGKWKATVSADDGGKEADDNLTFKGGQFTSENEKADGFDPATYEDDPSPLGAGAKFSVTLTNKAGDTAKWTGLSAGSEMDGTLVITKKDGTTKSYSFKATRS